MYRVFAYRGFEIHTRLTLASNGQYNVIYQVRGSSNLRVIGDIGIPTRVRNGPFALAKAYRVAECAGQAVIDAVIGADV